MNKLRAVILVPLRGYRRDYPSKNQKSRRFEPKRDEVYEIDKNITEKELYFDADENEFEPENFDDLGKYETDFSDADKTFKEHMHAQYAKKEKLKMQTIKRKYFKSEDPNFLTFTEKQEIKSLHAKDSVEWTAERLSESFPALPETIRKVLRADWLPSSARFVLKYDQKVIENWNLFKSGRLPMSPRLEAHLEKFKGRKIVAADMKTIAEKFVKPKPVFPEPKATLFTSLVQNYVETKETPARLAQISDGKEEKELAFGDLNISGPKRVNFDTFMEQAVSEIGDRKNLSMEMELLVDEYKRDKHEKALEDFKTLKARMEAEKAAEIGDNSGEIVEEKVEKVREDKTEAKEVPVFKMNAVTKKETETRRKGESLQGEARESKELGEVREDGVKVIYVDVPKLGTEENSPVTGIIEWKKIQVCGAEGYPQFIKIPRDKARKNVTFKVEDRYYDADGEFLYRVPGLKS